MRRAGKTVYDVGKVTPLERIGAEDCNLYLKREDLSPMHAYKWRGAYHRMAQLDPHQTRGVVAASAGNHAQGVAYSAKSLKIKSTIFMPKTTPSIKVDSVKNLGSKVILVGDNFDAALKESLLYCKTKKLPFIHPFDDPLVIAGQGTIGKEILEQFNEKIDIIFVAVGGGGLISGVGAYIKTINPKIKIIAVEADDAAGLNSSLAVSYTHLTLPTNREV